MQRRSTSLWTISGSTRPSLPSPSTRKRYPGPPAPSYRSAHPSQTSKRLVLESILSPFYFLLSPVSQLLSPITHLPFPFSLLPSPISPLLSSLFSSSNLSKIPYEESSLLWLTGLSTVGGTGDLILGCPKRFNLVSLPFRETLERKKFASFRFVSLQKFRFVSLKNMFRFKVLLREQFCFNFLS